jgi:hypothetical protein
MNTLQQNKIQKQLDSFIELGYTLTQTEDWNIVRGKTYCYELRKTNYKIECFYKIPTSGNRNITTGFYLDKRLPMESVYSKTYDRFIEFVKNK